MRIFIKLSHLQDRFLCVLPRWPEVRCEDAGGVFNNLYELLKRKKENRDKILVLSRMKIWRMDILVCKFQFQWSLEKLNFLVGMEWKANYSPRAYKEVELRNTQGGEGDSIAETGGPRITFGVCSDTLNLPGLLLVCKGADLPKALHQTCWPPADIVAAHDISDSSKWQCLGNWIPPILSILQIWSLWPLNLSCHSASPARPVTANVKICLNLCSG